MAVGELMKKPIHEQADLITDRVWYLMKALRSDKFRDRKPKPVGGIDRGDQVVDCMDDAFYPPPGAAYQDGRRDFVDML